ncbi:MAG: hypothetical protein R3192_08345 [Woeseiaceae bacterium]|nr:hypothetical protein [Woeseiaceae bacterium]
MKKFIIIITLALLQCACATPGSGRAAAMLDFDAIGSEISVAHDDLSPQYEEYQALASIHD